MVLLLALGTCKPQTANSPRQERLNLLLVTLDTTRADRLGCYGYAPARTPHLDQLAAEGIRFARCSTCASLTLPAHASIMTGQYPFVHGVRKNGTHRLAEANLTLAEVLGDAGFTTEAIVATFVLDRIFGIDQGFERYSGVPPDDSVIAVHAERRGDRVTSEAIDRLAALRDRRFFLWVHYFDPHYPYVSPNGGVVESFAGYDEEIAFVDAQIGHLRAALSALELDNNTVIVVVGDHGESLGEHGEYQHGYFTYETTLHVPLILWRPGLLPANRVVASRVRTIDVAPTVLELLGIPPLPDIAGESFASLWQNETNALARAAYGESFEAHDQFGLARLRSLAFEQWKYVLAPRAELYRLTDDPGERTNLVHQFPNVARDMRAMLRELIDSAPISKRDEQPLKLDAQARARLEALGYTGLSSNDASAGGASDDDELARFEPRGGDPKDHSDAMTAYAKAHWAMRAGRFALAESLLTPVTQRLPQAVRIRGDLAFALQNQGKTQAAERIYLQAIETAPNDAYLRRMYGGLLIRAGRWAAARDQLTVALVERPDDIEVLYNLAAAVAQLDRYAEAREFLARILELDPEHASSLHAMGAFHAREGHYEKAEAYFRKSLAVNPDHARARHDLAELTSGDSQP
jgi:choline-sulfatase